MVRHDNKSHHVMIKSLKSRIPSPYHIDGRKLILESWQHKRTWTEAVTLGPHRVQVVVGRLGQVGVVVAH